MQRFKWNQAASRSRLAPKPLLLLAAVAVSAVAGLAGTPVGFSIASTGQTVADGFDSNYTIISNTIKEENFTGLATVVLKQPTQQPGWPKVPKASWIAPDDDQSNSRNGCCNGIFKVITNFSLKDANGKLLDPSTVRLTLNFAADDGLDIYLYPTTKPANPLADAAHRIFSQGVFNAPATKILTGQTCALGATCSPQNYLFQPTVTDYTLEFDVNNNGLGPTGLAVYAEGTAELPCLLADGTACPTKLELSTSHTYLTAVSGAPLAQASQTLIFITNIGGGGNVPITTTIAPDDPNCTANGGAFPYLWQSTSTTGGQSPGVLLKVFGTDPVGNRINPGIYQASLQIKAGTATANVCVVAIITSVSPSDFLVSRTGVEFSAQVHQAVRADFLNVTAPPNVDFDLSVTSVPEDDHFLTVAKGTNGQINMNVATQSQAGRHYAVIKVTPSDKNLPTRLVEVVNTVTDDAPAPDLTAPDPIIAVQDSTTQSKGTVTVSAGSGGLTYAASGPAYVVFSPASGSLNPNSDTVISFTIDATKLKLGTNKGSIQFAFGNKTTESVPVYVVYLPRFAVPGALVSSKSGDRTATTGCTPQELLITGSGLPGGFTRRVGVPAYFKARLIDDCANPISGATLVMNFSNGESAVLAQADKSPTGSYTATWIPATAGDVTVTLRAAAGATVSTALSGSTTISGTVTATTVPLIYRGGVVSNLYPIGGGALAPGTVASIYGSHLAPATASPTSLPLPTSLQGTSVNIGGIDVPLYLVSDGQINVQIPAELSPYLTYPVIVRSSGGVSGVENITLSPASPGVAAFADGTIIAQHTDYSLVDAAHPAKPKEALILYLVGMGATNPSVATGQQAPSTPLATLPTPPKVTIDKLDAPIVFAGMTPGGIGLYQIVLTVPDGITTSGNKAVTISQSGTNANATTLPVKVP